jgi:hypothetical protein
MNDVKPLRQEDYQAMAEELRRTQEKLAPKPNKQTTSAMVPPDKSVVIGLLIIASAVTLLVALFVTMARDTDEQRATPNCYRIATVQGEAPWETKHWLWEYRKSRNHKPWENQTDRAFDTYDEGAAFMRKWNLRECP